MAEKRRILKRQRHSFLTRVKWWLRDRWLWFRGLKRWQQVLLVAGPIIFFVLVVPLLIYAYFALTMGDMEQVMNRNNTGVVLRDIHGDTFYSTGTAEHREILPLDTISPYVQQAVVASEDRNFYEHGGISILSTLRAVYGYVLSGGGEFGGSTLTQQLAKMTLLSTERGFLRQYQAFSVAIAIEQRYSKDEILSMYLNSAYFGNNSFGIEQAAKNYFDTQPAELTLAQSAMLIGLLPAPSVYSPVTGDAALGAERQAEVLKRMTRENMISEEERTDATETELSYQSPATIENDAPHFTEMVLAELYERYGEETVERSGYQVTTTLDLKLQRTTLDTVAGQRAYIEGMGGSNAGMIAIDPRSGEIRALVGSVDYGNEEWGAVNMATTNRQPGSTFKSLYYAAALADGVITPATIIKDEPININGYQPRNATRQHYGNVSVRQALARSLNIPAVKVMQQYGIDNSIEAAQKLGITTLDTKADYGLSLSIGSAEVPLQEMTNAYAAFANGGNLRENTTVHEIQNKYSRKIYEHESKAKEGISPQGAYLISDILSDQNARAPMFGSSLSVAGKSNVAVKTGTTDDNRDAWTIGYTPTIAVGVWVGNNNNDTMVSGGADMAGPIWRATMQAATGAADPEFPRPEGIVERNVCYGTGGLAPGVGTNTFSEVFLISALPTNTCSATPQQQEEEKRPEEDEQEEQVEKEPIIPEVEEEQPPEDPETPPEPGGPGNPGDPETPVPGGPNNDL